MAHKRTPLFRYLILAVTFCAVCTVYLGRLFYVQIIGREETPDDGTQVRLVTIPAVRGEIFDRNGKALVSNRYTYDLILSSAALSAVSAGTANRIYLTLLEALRVCNAEQTHTEAYFPFDGTYPDYSYSAASQDENTSVSFHLRRILKNLGMKETAKAVDLVREYLDTYHLTATDEQGNPLYTDLQIDRLLRLHYDMDAKKFGEGEDYTFAEDADTVLLTYVQEMSLVGVSFSVTADRVYRYPGYASHILGAVGPIYAEEWDYYNEKGYQMNTVVGKSGCELAFEEYLHGTDGRMRLTLDANGTVINTEILSEPQSGQDVWLTIDIDLQIAAEDALAENVAYVQERDMGKDTVEAGYECNVGAAVAMDPDTFEILAIASYPTYDLTTYNRDYNSLAADPAKPLLNHALRGTYVPGSTFKVLMSAAGLKEGLITSSTTFPCTGSYTFGSAHPKCSTWPHGTSSLTVTQALADSCNSFFYELGVRMGIETMSEYMKAFGIGEETGIELGELTGQRSERDSDWQPGNVLSAAIGQYNTQLTPLQICTMISSISNGGTRYRAHLLHEVRAFGSDTPSYTDAEILGEPLSRTELDDGILATVFAGMRQMITSSSTAQRFYTQAGVKSAVGGKTGTAEVWHYLTDEETGEETRIVTTNALFVGTAPYNDPELVISVVLENASSGAYASMTAARITAAWEQIKQQEG